MLHQEITVEEYGEIMKNEGIEQGIEQGIKQGIERGVEQGIEQGIKQGIEQGIEQGESMKAVEIAKVMKEKGMAISDIAGFTGLSLDEIKRL